MPQRAIHTSWRVILGIFVLVVLFGLSLIFAESITAYVINKWLLQGWVGMLVYVLLGIVSIVIAPIASIPLLPIAVAAWGPMITAILSIIAWTVGALIAYQFGKIIGDPIQKYSGLAERISSTLAKQTRVQMFWYVVVLRVLIPVDILSYIVGMFTRMPFWWYALATLIGVSPMAILMSYAVSFSKFIAIVSIIVLYSTIYIIRYLITTYVRT